MNEPTDQPPAASRPWYKKKWVWTVAAVGVIVAASAGAGSEKKKADVTASGKVSDTTAPAAAATTATTAKATTTTAAKETTTTTAKPTTTTTAAPKGPKTQFGDGKFIVGSDIAPGTYRAVSTDGCYWARLKGFGGSLDDILANNNTDDPEVVTIAAGDKGFESNDCGAWKPVSGPVTESRTSFGPGTYIIGTDIAPGTYRNEGESSCYWARLKGFGGSLNDIVTNENTDEQATVTIAASDKGFQSTDCGNWTKLS